MAFTKNLLMQAFGRPTDLLGRLGGVLMAPTNRTIAQRAIELLNVGPSDSVLEVGFGPASASSFWRNPLHRDAS